MESFAALFNQLDETSNAELRLRALVDYFAQAKEEDKIWAVGLLFDKRPKRKVTIAQVKDWGLEASELPLWLFEQSLETVGDAVELVSLVAGPTQKTTEESLFFWINHIVNLEGLEEEGKKAGLIEAWELLSASSRFVFNKLATGGFRTTMAQQTIAQAIAKHTGKATADITQRLEGNWQPAKITFEKLFLADHPNDGLSHPYPFFSTEDLVQDIATIGSADQWIAERKWDGIRAQIIVRSNKLFIWSADDTLITNKCPEFLFLANTLEDGTVLDGEILLRKKEQLLPLNLLKARLSKKKVSKKMLEETPLIFMAYDLLEQVGEDCRNNPLTERRNQLKEIVAKIKSTEKEPATIIELSPEIKFKDWLSLTIEWQAARAHSTVGLMLKKKDTPYRSGRTKGDWWKWKVQPMTIKTVLLYVQTPGWGGGLSSFTFAVWEGEKLVPVTKTLDGLSKDDIAELIAFARKNTVEKFGPVRSVKPEFVFDITFEAINVSSRHKCGIVLRNPAVLQWHRDAAIDEAHSLSAVKELLHHGEV